MELFLIAHIAGRGVAIESGAVDSVVDIADIVAVPLTDPAILGLVAIRSRVVTVIDTGVALGVAPVGTNASRAIITRVDGHHYAIVVDSLEDVASFERLPLSSGIALDNGWSAAGTGLVERAGEPILIVDLAALIPNYAIAA